MTLPLFENTLDFQTLAEVAGVGIIVFHRGKIGYVNPAVEELTGYSNEELLNPHTIERLLTPESRHIIAQIQQAHIDEPLFPLRREASYLTKSGELRWGDFNIREVEFNNQSSLVAMFLDVTESVQAGFAIRDNEARLSAYFEQASDLILTLDQMGVITSVNQLVCNLTGYSKEEIIGKSPLDFIASDQREAVNEVIIKQLRDGVVDRIETEIVSKDGVLHWIEIRGQVINDGNQLGSMLLIARVITARKQAEGALRHQRDFAESLINNAQAIVLVLDTEGRIQRFNPYMERITGYNIEDVRGKHWFTTFLPEDDQRHIGSIFQEVINGTPLHGFVTPVLTKHHQTRLIEWNNVPLKDQHDIVIGVLSIGQDVTERKSIEDALHESEKRYELATSAGHVGVWDLNLETDEVYIDPIIKSMLDISTEGYSNQLEDWQKQIHPDDIQQMLSSAKEHLEGATPRYEITHRVLNKNGDTRWLLTRGVAFRDLDDKPYRILGTVTDVTERKLVEDKLNRLNIELTSYINRLEQRNQEVTILNEMGDMLQSCRVVEDAYAVIGEYAEELFPIHQGALLMLTDVSSIIEVATTWGEHQPEDYSLTLDSCWALRRGRMHVVDRPESRLRCKHFLDSDRLEFTPYLCTPMSAHGEIFGVLHLMCSPGGDISEWKQLAITVAERTALAVSNLKLRMELHLQSIHDPLTGLFNRRFMGKMLEREVHRAARQKRPLSIVMLDIDFFKNFNDNYGHDAGDKLIQALGNFMETQTRTEDIVCRYGGDEFTIIMPETSADDAAGRLEILREAVTELHVLYQGERLEGIHISIGVASYPEIGDNSQDLLKAADKALYRAKDEGRNRVVIAGND
jgi:diguanylate cyclase (GGDEF)-like protein/PAS domain S-box-containing protein